MPFKYPQLSVELEDDVLKDIGYTRQQLENDKLLLRAWLDEQAHFPESCKKENDAFLVNYLVGCKGSLETVKTKLDFYYSMRGHGDLFLNRDTLDYLKSASTFQYVAVMPKPSPEGYIVTMVGLWTDDVNKYIMNDAIKRIILVHEWGLRQGSGIIRGVVFLLDAKGFSAAHTMQLTLSTIKSIVAWLTQACPMRPHRFIVINVEPLLESIANTVIMPLLPEKIKKRTIFTRDDDLTKYLDSIEFLPTSYGGEESDKVTLARPVGDLGKSENFIQGYPDKCIFEMCTSTLYCLCMQPEDCMEALIAGTKDILPTLGESTDESKRPKLHGYTNDPHFGAFGSIKNLVTD